jgi:hypothetical protein
LSGSGWFLRLKRRIYLVPPQIPAGGKYIPGSALILQKLMEEEQGRYQICGPSAFNFYGLDDQIPSVPLYNLKSRTFPTYFHEIPDCLYSSILINCFS